MSMAALRARVFVLLGHHLCKCEAAVKNTVEFQQSLRTFSSAAITHKEPTRFSAVNKPSTNWMCLRFYSKGKDKAKGGDKKTKKVAVQVSEEELAEVINADALKRDLQHAIDRLKDDYIKHVSLRSSAGTLENLTVEVDGDKYTVQELGQIGRKGPQMVVVNLASFPQVIPNVLKAIQDSGMGLNPQQDGMTLFITIPKVTKEHRENLAKNAKTLMNKCKDHLRDVHNKYSKDAKKKEKDISADLLFSVQQQIQVLTEQHVHEAEKLLAAKQQELLGS